MPISLVCTRGAVPVAVVLSTFIATTTDTVARILIATLITTAAITRIVMTMGQVTLTIHRLVILVTARMCVSSASSSKNTMLY